MPASVYLHPRLAGAAYTCKDRVEGNSGGWQVAGSPFTGKDRYEFEKFFAPRTVLTLSESVFRFIDMAGSPKIEPSAMRVDGA
jgi:hypothetical protein